MSHDFPSSAISIASTPTGSPNAGGMEEEGIAKSSESRKQATTIDTLPDNVVLRIFHFCRIDHDPDAQYPPRPVWDWYRLVHVCQKWRQIVFASPRSLDLQIFCTFGTPVEENLGCWPALPIAVDYWTYFDDEGYEINPFPYEGRDNAIAALEHPDRVYSIKMSGSLEEMDVVLHRPFPVLKSLTLQGVKSYYEVTQALPDTFLGGSTPLLQKIALVGFPFPTFPTFIRTARDLVKLQLINIPQIGSISAGMLAAGLAALTKLEYLHISFEYLASWLIHRLDQRPAIPLTRIVLPALTGFHFVGAHNYLEEFVAPIETPQLEDLTIRFITYGSVVQVPQLTQFISRAEHLKLAEYRRACVHFSVQGAHISFNRSQAGRHPCYLDLTINGHHHHLLAPFMFQLLTQLESSPIISNVRHLSIATFDEWTPRDDAGPAEWLMFLRPFTAVETLWTCDRLSSPVITALEDSSEDMVAATTLPALQLLNLEGHPLTPGVLKKFIAFRQLSGRPVTIDNARKYTHCELCHYHPTECQGRAKSEKH